MSAFQDLTNQKFGRLTVKFRGENDKSNHTRWWCECDCGNSNLILVSSSHLKSGHTSSCGCLRNEMTSVRNQQNKKKYNTFDLESEEYGIGYTLNGEKYIFDKEDYNKIKNICWFIKIDENGFKSVYGYYNKLGKCIFLHRFLYDLYEFDNEMIIDHINHDHMDNRKCNLRIANYVRNAQNRKKEIRNTSGVTGVCWRDREQAWMAYITVDYKQIILGYYIDKQDAIKARKNAEDKYFGEWSYNNSISISN